MCEIIMLIFGIITLVRGKFLLTRAKEVRGWPARIIGVLLIMPLPLSVVIGGVLGVVFAAMEKQIGGPEFKAAAGILGVVTIVLCLILAIGVAMAFAEPIRKKRPTQEDVVIPAGYDERFEPGALDNPKSQGITGGPSHPPTAPDDRIQS